MKAVGSTTSIMKHEQDDACFTEDEKSTGLETPPMLKDVRLTLDPKALAAADPDLEVVKKVAANLASCASSITICVIEDTDGSDATSNSVDEKGNPVDLEAGPKKKSKKKRSRLITDEPWHITLLQICVPFFIAGLGTIGAGLVLAKVKNWDVFKEVSQIFILVPALLGLKGNLDMCLASRLSTQANLGNMKSPREIGKMIIGNLALVQVQATVAATLVAMFATGVSAVMNGEYSWDHFLLVMSSSVCTAASSCFILDLAMIIVIMAAYKMKMNPDNLATPLAASIGDVVSLSVLSAVASQLYHYQRTDDHWILYAIIVLFFGLLPIWICIVLKNKYTKPVLTSGWVPVISALFISGLGGLILDKAVNTLNGFDVFAPIINGIGGNLVSVHASRISSMLHQSSVLGALPSWTKTWVSPWKALFHGQPTAKTARLLLAMAVPGHVAFSFVADYLRWGKTTVHVYFVASYLTVALIQVALLLYVAHVMIHIMWKYKVDPDNSAIPYLTALGDLSGSLLLAAAFKFLSFINHEYYNCPGDCGEEDLLAIFATTTATPGAF